MILDKKACVPPRLVIEVSVDGESKENQLLGCINDLSECWPAGYQFLVLGAIVVASSSGYSVSIYGFYHVFDPESDCTRIAQVFLDGGSWCSEMAARVLAALRTLRKIPMNQLLLGGRRVLPKANRKKHVVLSSDWSLVTKVFDYRQRVRGLVDDDSRRRYQLSIEYLGAQVVVESRCAMLHVIQYPYIAGTHVPTRVAHIVSLIHTLGKLHEKDLVFGDLRLRNVIFKRDYSSSLIDFDWSGIHGINVYPSGFNPHIKDGVRHPDAIGGRALHKQHDMFALGGLMNLFETAIPAMMAEWTAAIRLLVMDYNLQATLSLLSNEAMQETELHQRSQQALKPAQTHSSPGLVNKTHMNHEVTAGGRSGACAVAVKEEATKVSGSMLMHVSYHQQPRCSMQAESRLAGRDSLLVLHNGMKYEPGKRPRTIENGEDCTPNKRCHMLQETAGAASDGGESP